MKSETAKRILDRTPEHTKQEVAEWAKHATVKRGSFDFDSTMSQKQVQKIAKQLIKNGVEVWIVTRRGEDRDNRDLFEVAENLGITNIHFTNFKDKWEFFKDNNFLFHLDDDVIELSMIKSYTKITTICHCGWGEKFGGKEKWKIMIKKLCGLKN